MMNSKNSYPLYRYVILGVFMLITVAMVYMLGFFVMSAGPVGFQYAAEVSYPAPESASQGILLWVGQLTGMVFVAGMSIRNNQFLGTFMTIFAILTLLAFAGVLLLRESPMILTDGQPVTKSAKGVK